MSKKSATLRIKLMSDICAGSGYSYEGVVDTDVCYNENGIPYIPGKRIKGCLREAAELIRIGNNHIKAIFGEGGYHNIRGLQVGNAYPEGSEAIDCELDELKKSDSEYKPYLTQQNVLSYYSRICVQTKIDDNTGTAQSETLRFVRVVNQYVDGKELEFLANIIFDGDTDEMIKIVKALRHIGMERNRGLGNVKCTLEDIKEEVIEEEVNDQLLQLENGEEKVAIRVIVKNVQPLMLSMNNDSKTENYIGGQIVLGALAGAYICSRGYEDRSQASDDPIFRDLFLNGTTTYSNFYITKKKVKKKEDTEENNTEKEDNGFRDYVPAPQFLRMLKKTEVLVNIAGALPEDELGNISYKNEAGYNTAGGNIPKKLNGKFVHIPKDGAENRIISLAEPVTEIVFHHSRDTTYDKGRRQEREKGILYTMEILEKNQYFSGEIRTLRKYEKILKRLLKKPLYFGKSKTAQYGLCHKIGECETQIYEPLFIAEKGQKIMVALESDAIFIGDYGYTIRYEEIRKQIADVLGIKYEENDIGYCACETKVISGYNTMWNLKKPSVPAISAGSVISYTLTETCVITRDYVGEKNMEGFGKVRLYNAAALQDTFEEEENKVIAKTPEKTKALLKGIFRERLLDAMIEKAFDQNEIDISASALGRLILMLEESLNCCRDSHQEAFKELKRRVSSIERVEVKNQIYKCMAKYIGGTVEHSRFKADDGEKISICVDTLIGSSEAAKEVYQLMKKLYKGEEKQLEEDVKALWGEYFMQLLICQKYKKAEARG